MFSLDGGLCYWLYSEPTDMRKSFHTLSGVVRNKIGGDPMNGDVYILSILQARSKHTLSCF